MIREINHGDLQGLLELYTQLHDNPIPNQDDTLKAIWEQITADKNHYIIVAEEDGRIVSSCVVVIILNLTHAQQPYALVENVVTDATYRQRGLASACLERAKDIAVAAGCYKIMLMTGSKLASTLAFYERNGYNASDKTGLIQWI